MLQTATDQPERLAESVGFELARHNWRSRRRCDRIARTVTPLVMDTMVSHGLYDSSGVAMALDSHKRLCGRLAAGNVKAGLGIFQYLLWQWILPLVIEWIIEWYFSRNGEAMRARHRAEAEA